MSVEKIPTGRDIERLVGGLVTLKIALATGLSLMTVSVLLNKALKDLRINQNKR